MGINGINRYYPRVKQLILDFIIESLSLTRCLLTRLAQYSKILARYSVDSFQLRNIPLKKLLSFVLLGLLFFSFALQSPALADGDPAKGAQVFSAYCASCHIGGKNVVMANKTLKKEALAKYLKGFSEDAQAAITYQVTNGKGAMPAFKGRLKPDQIENVAAYVVDKAEKGW